MIAPSGRTYYRRNNGCVMCYFDHNEYRELFIADAVYRTYKLYGSSNLPVSNNKQYTYIYPSVDPLLSNRDQLMYVGSDELIDSTDYCSTYRSNYLCNEQFKQQSGTDTAVGYAASIGYTIPTISQLVRIFCDSLLIDRMDPTVDTYSDMSLTNWFDKYIPFAWTCEQWDWYYQRVVRSNGLVGFSGKTDIPGGVIPVCEIL